MSDQKDTIYIDIDDEITSIIDKVSSSNKKVVALVLPKRATVMQSVVNMRLLKRASDDAGKNLVLITSDASVLPLAGVVGMYTAKTLQSRPSIPESNQSVDDDESTGDDIVEEDNPKNTAKVAGAAAAGLAAGAALSNDEETIEVDNDQAKPEGSATGKTSKAKSAKKDKKLKIPNFDSFRMKLFAGIGIVLLLIIMWFVAFKVMPKATITIKTNATTDPLEVTFVADPEVNEVDVQNGIVPAKVLKTEKTKTEKTASTGEKNLGEKAEGTVTMQITTNCTSALPTVPAGTTVSSSGLNFITQKSATLGGTPNIQNGKCVFSSSPTDVVASEGGGKYNLSERTYTVSGFNSIVANGSNMTGGTDKIVKIVSQQDVDTAKNKALEGNVDQVKSEMKAELEKDGYTAIVETFNNSEPVVNSTPAVGTEANEVSVTVVTTYTMTGAKTEDIKKVIDEQAKDTIDTQNQSISDYGLDNATYKVGEVTPAGKIKITLNTTITTGTQLDSEKVKKDAAGKRRGEIQDQLKAIPGVIDVEVAYKPFWVSKTPTNPDKITVVVQNEGE
jgi:hypothetical protein